MTDKYNCEIEIDFARQSFRVFRKPSLPYIKDQTASLLSPYMGRLQAAYSDSYLPTLEFGRTPPVPRANNVDKVRSVPRYSFKQAKLQHESGQDMAAGSILSAIHVPLRPDNNFEKIFNQMLPDENDRMKNRCFCKPPRPEVDLIVNKLLCDLISDLSKTDTEEIIESPTGKSKAEGRQTSTISIGSILNTESKFWVGSEYRYNAETNNLLLKFVLIGKPPDNARKLFLIVRAPGRHKDKPKRVKLTSSQENQTGSEITIPMVSYMRTLEVAVHMQLYVKRGFLRRSKCIDEWRFPLDDCHCMYQRSFWRDIIYI